MVPAPRLSSTMLSDATQRASADSEKKQQEDQHPCGTWRKQRKSLDVCRSIDSGPGRDLFQLLRRERVRRRSTWPERSGQASWGSKCLETPGRFTRVARDKAAKVIHHYKGDRTSAVSEGRNPLSKSQKPIAISKTPIGAM